MIGRLRQALETRFSLERHVGGLRIVDIVLEHRDAFHRVGPISHHRFIRQLCADALNKRWLCEVRMQKGKFKPREGILRNGLVKPRDADVQMSSHGVSFGRPRTIDVSWTSRDEHLVLARDPTGLQLVRAGSADAEAVTTFLLEQDVRPAPRHADIVALIGRSDAALFCAVSQGDIKGLAATITDGSLCHLIHFLIAGDNVDEPASQLIALVERAAREAGAVILTAETARDSNAYTLLLARGFSVDWEEGDAARGRVVTMVHLLKAL
jgi:hypothetical protein